MAEQQPDRYFSRRAKRRSLAGKSTPIANATNAPTAAATTHDDQDASGRAGHRDGMHVSTAPASTEAIAYHWYSTSPRQRRACGSPRYCSSTNAS